MEQQKMVPDTFPEYNLHKADLVEYLQKLFNNDPQITVEASGPRESL
jgi:hypothetical protein